MGIIGLGRVGIAVACRARVFGFKVIFYDPYVKNGNFLKLYCFKPLGIEKSLGIERYDTLEEVLSLSDCISLHCSLSNETNFLINNDTLLKFKVGAFLVNTAASELVLNTALLNGLKNGRIRAAALDIYDKDPNNSLISGNLIS